MDRVHPTQRQQVFEPSNNDTKEDIAVDADPLSQELLSFACGDMHDGIVAAIGEMGSGHDRLKICPVDTQCKYFIKQSEIVESVTGLPVFTQSICQRRLL